MSSRIQSPTIPPRPRTGGIAEVARVAGVSTATVSRALMSPHLLRPETRNSVMRAVAATGYTPNRAARSLRARKTMMAMVIVPNIANPFFAEILRGIDGALSEAGYGLIIGNLDNSREKEGQFVDLAFAGQVDGILLLSGSTPIKDSRSMRDAGLPIVAMSTFVDEPGMPQIMVEDRKAAANSARFLADLGHRHFGYVSGPAGNWVEAERWAGFQQGIAEAGGDPAAIVRWQGDFYFQRGAEAAEIFLAMAERPTGVLAASDELAIGFMKVVQRAGLRIPQDVSVIGFDGIEFADFCEPTLTTNHQPRHELGRAGAKVLLAMIADPAAAPPAWTSLSTPLVPRDSTGPAPIDP